jgi:hypothetical protein
LVLGLCFAGAAAAAAWTGAATAHAAGRAAAAAAADRSPVAIAAANAAARATRRRVFSARSRGSGRATQAFTLSASACLPGGIATASFGWRAAMSHRRRAGTPRLLLGEASVVDAPNGIACAQRENR